MRLRLLVDVEIDEVDIAKLAELMADQPVTYVRIVGDYDQARMGRFMGAQPVHGGEEI